MLDFDIDRVPVKQPTIDEKIKELCVKLSNAVEVLEGREKMIANLQSKIEELQEAYNKLVKTQYHQDYTVENQKKRIEDLGKTLELYTRENKAMRELLRQWI